MRDDELPVDRRRQRLSRRLAATTLMVLTATATGCWGNRSHDNRPSPQPLVRPFDAGRPAGADVRRALAVGGHSSFRDVRAVAIAHGRNGEERAVLWLAPTRGTGLCIALQARRNGSLRDVAGTCGMASPSVGVIPLIKPLGRNSVLVGGASFAKTATSVAIRYPNGRVEESRLVRVTGLPFSGAFFLAVIRRSGESSTHHERLDVRDSDGRAIPGQTLTLP
jgi:hypothetical protein